MARATVSGLHIYPVKSFGGISLNESEIEKRGLRHDRRWMLVDAEGKFMTQRTDTRLALFRTGIELDGLVLTNPAGDRMIAPFEPQGRPRQVQVWKDTCDAIQVLQELDEWFSEFLGQSCSLVYMPDNSMRATNPEFTQAGDIVGFADAFPILVIGESSLAHLNAKLDEPLPMNRFRPNVVVTGWAAHQEDEWTELRIGDLVLRAAKRCGRCSVTATDQETGEVGLEPLRTLASYRLNNQSIQFGAYFVPERPGRISVGGSAEGLRH